MTFVFTWSQELDFLYKIKNLSIEELLTMKNSNIEEWQVRYVNSRLAQKKFEELRKK